jgi:hypothetical protein
METILLQESSPGTRSAVGLWLGTVFLDYYPRRRRRYDWPMEHYSYQGGEGVCRTARGPRQDLGVVHTTMETLQPGNWFQASLTDGIHVQTAFVARKNNLFGPWARLRGWREDVEAKEVALLASLHP